MLPTLKTLMTVNIQETQMTINLLIVQIVLEKIGDIRLLTVADFLKEKEEKS